MGMIQNIMQQPNPANFMVQMAQYNPSMQTVQQQISNAGGDAKTAFYSQAKTMGIDPTTIISTLNSYGYKTPA